jgi:hypothetical protein
LDIGVVEAINMVLTQQPGLGGLMQYLIKLLHGID